MEETQAGGSEAELKCAEAEVPGRPVTVSDAAGIDADALAEVLTPLIDRALGRLIREGRYRV